MNVRNAEIEKKSNSTEEKLQPTSKTFISMQFEAEM